MNARDWRIIIAANATQAAGAVVLLLLLSFYGMHVTRLMEIVSVATVCFDSVFLTTLAIYASRLNHERDQLVKGIQLRQKAWLS